MEKKSESHSLQQNLANLAPPIQDQFFTEESFRDLSERGNYNYLLKCTDGIFSGKFLFINTTPDGELFGSGDPDTIDLTMYIESADLSEKHAEIKFIDNAKYVLRDCGSEGGTWVRINREVDLYSQNRRRVYKVQDYHFVIEESTNGELFDEVTCWLRKHGFIKYIEAFRTKGVDQLRDIPKAFKRQDLKKIESDNEELDRFFGMMEDLENDEYIQKQPSRKKLLYLKFLKGPLLHSQPREIPLICDKPLTFGCKESQSKDISKFLMNGDRIVDQHFEILFDNNTIVLRNLNMNCWESCGVYRRLFDQESYSLRPGHAFRIGTLEFLVERFNTGIVSDIGQRQHMEDSYACIQDMMIDEEISVTYYAVFDGHGGADCAQYLRDNFHVELKNRLIDQVDGIRDTEDFNQTVANCIERAFEDTDNKYKLKHPQVANQCGATAVVVLILGNKLVCANVGDARAVLCRNGKAIDLSLDQKASRADEQERIKQQGGYIVFGRVLGRLAVTRAFGDFDCKNIDVVVNEETNEKETKQFVLIKPEIRVVTLDPSRDHFVLLASDGLFDRFSSQDCVNIVREKLLQMPIMEQDPQKVARELVNEAIYKRLITDNITVILATLNRGIDSTLFP